ncbi:MAG: UDP-N-acetylmuramoyl-tripeptide--D-alanyl-D-alanine ligase [Acidobacteria bacterium]|jgi:UDP-N-acetylmuramoyl-tripeptide--D-alanyl-D-alanine ligase|nr:UDP-N-acetylmuramoyl-tripeptide--D-alanyl-D-alanine ligase [Acidobacteriota bacterium]
MIADELARTLGGTIEGESRAEITGAEVDSRRLREGDLFVALEGERLDGHDFVANALETAAAALVREERQLAPPPAGRALIRVSEPLAAYHELATLERRRRTWKIVGITGSVGKTTTKEFLGGLLSTRFRAGVSAGNRNSTLGLPAQLISQPEDTEIFVAEMGMNHPGELEVLGRIVRPDVLLYTRLALTHTEFLSDMETLVRAKAELLPYLNPSGCLIINHEDPHQAGYPELSPATLVRYGGEGSAVRIESLEDWGLLGTTFRLVVNDDSAEVELAIPGRHQADNLLAAAAAAATLGLSAEEISVAAGRLEAAEHRGRVYRTEAGVTVVDDSYNSSPLAVRRLLSLLAKVQGRRVAVLGEMYELGEQAAEAHTEIGREAAGSCDLLIAVGGEDATRLAQAALDAGMEAPLIHLIGDAEEAARRLTRVAEPGDVVLVKGSRGVGLDRTVASFLEGGA